MRTGPECGPRSISFHASPSPSNSRRMEGNGELRTDLRGEGRGQLRRANTAGTDRTPSPLRASTRQDRAVNPTKVQISRSIRNYSQPVQVKLQYCPTGQLPNGERGSQASPASTTPLPHRVHSEQVKLQTSPAGQPSGEKGGSQASGTSTKPSPHRGPHLEQSGLQNSPAGQVDG